MGSSHFYFSVGANWGQALCLGTRMSSVPSARSEPALPSVPVSPVACPDLVWVSFTSRDPNSLCTIEVGAPGCFPAAGRWLGGDEARADVLQGMDNSDGSCPRVLSAHPFSRVRSSFPASPRESSAGLYLGRISHGPWVLPSRRFTGAEAVAIVQPSACSGAACPRALGRAGEQVPAVPDPERCGKTPGLVAERDTPARSSAISLC